MKPASSVRFNSSSAQISVTADHLPCATRDSSMPPPSKATKVAPIMSLTTMPMLNQDSSQTWTTSYPR